ncbi:methanogenesis marker protein 11 [Methanocella sp. MCL-LM]|uniref:methanogenesis marker protein 11 n=1 Tax=Methanocella sp. MCL-LM TaxID=3412035 RepID=UPI003C709142
MEKDVSFTQKKWVLPYKNIVAVADGSGLVDIIEQSNCWGGACWAEYHYKQASPLIENVCSYGNTMRYRVKEGTSELNLIASYAAAGIESAIVKDKTISITYAGLGGGGVGATMSRAQAEDVIEYDLTEAGGSKKSRGTIVLPRRSRVLIGVDDTDTKEEGATWSLIHNIATDLDSKNARYVSHALVQLFPVPQKTQNCVSTVVEFACIDPASLIKDFEQLLRKYTLSENTGMVVLQRFEADEVKEYAALAKSKMVTYEIAEAAAKKAGVEIVIPGRGIIGALASLPYFAQPCESVKLNVGNG